MPMNPMIDMNRMKRLFSPSPEFQQATGMNEPVQPQAPVYEPPDFEPAPNQSLQRFLELAVPERNNPSLLSKIGASMASFGHTPENVDKALYAPYYGKLADYQNQANNLLKGATVESQQNNYAGLNAYRQGQLGLGQQRVDNTRANTSFRQQDATQRTKIAQDKLEIERQRARHAGARLLAPKGGNFMWSMPDGTQRDTGISTGTYTDQQRLQVEQDNALERLEESGGNSLRNIGANAAAQAAVAAGNRDQMTPGQYEQQIENRASTLLRIKPEWRDFVTKNPQTGQWEVAPEAKAGRLGFMGKGPTKEIREMIVNYLNTGEFPNQPEAPAQNPGLPPVQPVPPGQGQDHSVNQTPIGGNNPEITGANYSGYGPKTNTVQLTRPPGDPNNPMGFGQSQVMTKTQTNRNTGEKRTMYSRDGGKTWSPQ